MKTKLFLFSTMLAFTTSGAFALSTEPGSFSTAGQPPAGDGNSLVVFYSGNGVGLAANSPEAMAQQIASQPIDEDLISQIADAVGTPVTPQKIANALSQFIAANPTRAISATAMAVVLANRSQLPVNNQISIIASGVQGLARQGDGNVPGVAALIGFAAQLAPAEQRAAVISEMRQLAINNMPVGSPAQRATSIDTALVQESILQANTVPPNVLPILAAQTGQTDMVVELLTPPGSREGQVGQIAAAATTAGEGMGANAFASGGAVDTPDNPAGAQSNPTGGTVPPPIPSPTIFPSPTPLQPDPTPTPPEPYGA